ncbi:hypothetical protein Y032_0323g2491 [Ancylostoma ceylanicum]|nr:hypothetical protein Y032_0323g2491 [Ancylostoma ceylanicum]
MSKHYLQVGVGFGASGLAGQLPIGQDIYPRQYLGSLLEEKKVAATAEVNSRIGKASAAFASLKWCVWKENGISLTTKMRLFRTLVMPILFYGSETWTLLKLDLNKLETFQMRCLRQIRGISILSRIRNEHIRDSCGHQPTVEEQIRIRRLRWFGHVCRMDTTRLPGSLLWRKRPTQWKVQRAAPKKTWIKQVEADLKTLRCSIVEAKIIAANRQEWKRVVQAIRTPVAATAVLRGRTAPPDTS